MKKVFNYLFTPFEDDPYDIMDASTPAMVIFAYIILPLFILLTIYFGV